LNCEILQLGNANSLVLCVEVDERGERLHSDLAKDIVPGIKAPAIPHGLQVQRGVDAVVEYLTENIPKFLS